MGVSFLYFWAVSLDFDDDDFDDGLVEDYRESALGYPLGLTCWVLTGVMPECSKSGPRSFPPISMNGGKGKRKGKGSRGGRPPVEHKILDAAKSRLLRYRKPEGKASRDHALFPFRKVVWFLLLASYSPHFVRRFLKGVHEDYYRKLSYKGAVSSVGLIHKEAVAGEILLDRGFQEILKEYRAGPWAHDAPDWLRAQYGVPLAEPKSVGKDSRKGKGKDSGKDVAGSPAVVLGSGSGRSLEDFQKEKELCLTWDLLMSRNPSLGPLTPGEITLGIAEGISSILVRREAAGVFVGQRAGEAPGGSPVVPPSVVDEKGLRALKVAKVLEEVSQFEALVGVSLNLTSVELAEAVDSGLLFVLGKRQGSGSSGLAGETVVPAIVKPAGPDVSGVGSVGGGDPGDSRAVDVAVASGSGLGSGDLVAPVEPVKGCKRKDGAPVVEWGIWLHRWSR